MPSIVDYLAGYTNQGTMRDFQHASRLYLDNNYALAPKTSWIYYVVFSIDPRAITEVQWKNQRRDYEAGMLVKSCDLPKFSIQTETLNQYNRKTNVQTKINYSPISFAFHDDQSNVTNSLWVNYFRYYYRDTWHGQKVGMTNELTNKPAAFKNNKYEGVDSYTLGTDGRPGTPGSYGLNNNQSVPFFNAITIYQLNQKRFTSYVIVNPLITAWEHDKLDQTSGSKFAENKMTIAYESVFYGEGRVKRDSPSGFATFHYDITPSPLSIAGGGTNSVFGPGGFIDGIDDIFGAQDGLLSRGLNGNPLNLLGAGIAGANLIKNARNITRESLKAEGKGILQSALQGALSGGGGGFTGMLQGGLGSLGNSLGFGPKTGTLLVGSNFVPNRATASPGDVVPQLPSAGLGNQVDPKAYAKAQADATVYTTKDIEQLKGDDLPDAKAAMDQRETDTKERLAKSESLQAEYTAKIKDAEATDAASADAIRREYASKGYEDPAKLRVNLEAINDSRNAIISKIESNSN